MITKTLCFCQEVETVEKEKKIAYSFFTEYGLGVGGLRNDGISVEFTGILVNGITFNQKRDMVGLGVGCDLFYMVMVQSYPLFANYRHYFSSKTDYKPLINIAMGTELSFWHSHRHDGYSVGGDETSKIQCSAGLYTTIAGGFRRKSLSFTSGFFVKSWEIDVIRYGIEIKVGYTF